MQPAPQGMRGLGVWLRPPWPLSILVSLVGAALAFAVIRPQVGVDDANITFLYARHIADGLGYVYNVGGERVEGSTSLLWTGLTSLFFLLSDHPEPLLALACFGMTVVTVRFGIGVGELIAEALGVPVSQVRLASAAGLLMFPGFFAWSVWTLMDLSVWAAALTVLLYFGLRLAIGTGETGKARTSRIAFLLAAGVLPAIRPEGVAIALGLALGLAAYSIYRRRFTDIWTGIGAAALAIAVFAGITFWRLEYFGYPLPNTFYAKVSTGIASQALAGARYVISFLIEFPNVLIVAAALGVGAYVRSGSAQSEADRLSRDILIAPLLYLAGFCIMYAVLGGDHFAFHRFMQPVIPVLAPVAAIAAVMMWRAAGEEDHSPGKRAATVAGAGVIALASLLHFSVESIGLAKEFRIAEDSRANGEILNTLPGRPSLGVLPAGGIAMTYEGRIYDLLGLNWTKMAHAVDDLGGAVRNHGSFDRALFFRARPDLLMPAADRRPCQPAGAWPDKFHHEALKGLLYEPEFTGLYAQACYKGVQIYVRRDLLPGYAGLMQKPPGEQW